MTQATKEATVEGYMNLLKEGDGDQLTTFVKECFGSDEDFDLEACDAFAKEVEAPAKKYIKEQYMNVPEATEEMVSKAEAVNGSQQVATGTTVQEEVVNTEEVVVETTEEV